VLSIVTGLAFGLTAAVPAVRRTTSDSLRGTALNGTGTPATHRLRSFLVVTEMALSGMLLVGAVLLARSVLNLQRVDPGFVTRDLYAVEMRLPRTRYESDESRHAFAVQLASRVAGIAGVRSVAAAQATPPDAGFMMGSIEAEASNFGSTAPGSLAMNSVAPNYFATLGLRLVRGRSFTDASDAQHEVIINEGFAKKAWPNRDAVGMRIRFPTFGPDRAQWLTVVGVAGDIPILGLSGDPTQPMLYFPLSAKDGPPDIDLAVRAAPSFDPATAIQQAATTLDRRLPPPTVKSVASAMLETIASQRFTMELLTVFAMLAVLLSAIGLYGVISYIVTQRTREIGIRIALGATPRLVARVIVARALVLSVAGLAAGLVASVWATKLITSALYGVSGTDAASYTATAALLLAISLVACVVPMRRAMRVDPVIAMRGE
jgi:predicted permease